MQEAVLTMFVQKRHAYFQPYRDWLSAFGGFPGEVFCRTKFRIEDRFSADTACCWSSEVDAIETFNISNSAVTGKVEYGTAY